MVQGSGEIMVLSVTKFEAGVILWYKVLGKLIW